MSKRKHADASLTCSLVRGVGYELIWSVDDVSRVLHSRVPVTSEWLEVGGLVCELMLQPYAAAHPSGQETCGLLFSALDAPGGRNLPATVRFQVINHACPSWTATLEEGSGGVLRLGTGSWASEHLIPVAALTDPQLGFVVGDRLLIRVEARYC